MIMQKSENKQKQEEIAVIGISCKFPDANSHQEYWENLQNGRFSVKEIPADRWNTDQYYSPHSETPNTSISKWGGFLDRVDTFDTAFFKISPREAEWMDPQQRILLELTWKCIEDAGYPPLSFQGKSIGLFLGVGGFDYKELLERSQKPIEGHFSTGICVSIIPNRISHWFDFKGPSIPIDTACSGSLVALHEAIHSINRNECEMALVGGMSILCSPTHFISFSKTGMLSPQGVCRTFDASADGYVRGEGLGLILLKPLSKAIEAQDQIYGVIKATAVNHGGRVATITSPNPYAQTRVIVDAFEQADISPTTIRYIEAHGTGTPKGDPIEINALKRAFRSLAKKQNITLKDYTCGLGSVKTNIGHLEPASGIAGLIKVLLIMKHQKIPKLLHYKKLNPKIKLENSPFYVVDKEEPWLIDSQEDLTPLRNRAGISSFGFGGVNAHVILEEYPAVMQNGHSITDDEGLFLFLLSAKNLSRLQDQAKQFIEWLQSADSESTTLAQIAYTLQVGREVMESRLAMSVSSKKELLQKLQIWQAGKKDITSCWQTTPSGALESSFEDILDEPAKQELIKRCMKARDLKRLALFWISGGSISWKSLYPIELPKRISLPTYCFAPVSHWLFPKDQPQNILTQHRSTWTSNEFIHPLLHENTSDLSEQRFSSTFTGKEFFLADHRVKGAKVFPGVGYLEMARAAVEKASGQGAENASLQLKNIVWTQPLVINESAKAVHIGVFEADDGQIQYEIYSDSETAEAVTIHSQGMAEFKAMEERPSLVLQDLRSEMQRGVVTADTCYQAFDSMGLEYGSGHRGIAEIYQGNNQVLAKLTLPSCIGETQDEYVLHPSLLDAALQASIGLILDEGNQGPLKLQLPFALESLEVLNSCSPAMFAWVRCSQGSPPSDQIRKLDIDLCDEQGAICVKMRGFSSRSLKGPIGDAQSKEPTGTLLAIPTWKERPIAPGIPRKDYARYRIMLCDMAAGQPNELESLIAGSQCLKLESKQKTIESRFIDHALSCFESIRDLLAEKPQGRVLLQIVVPHSGEQSLFSGLSGILKTAALENPKVVGQIIQVDPGETSANLAKKLQESRDLPEQSVIKYEQGKRWVSTWAELKGLKETPEMVFKEKGVYLISGGLGGLGILFAQEILKQTPKSTLILTGRSSLSAQKESVLQDLQSCGATVVYRTVDVCDFGQVTSLTESIQRDFGKLNGIIHSAGVIADNFILKKTPDEFKKVLAPKVTGTINLDTATKDLALDFFVLFSSIAGVIGSLGQVDYATANAFMDRFAAYRNELVVSRQRYGNTFSINWPLWKDGGMKVASSSELMMKQLFGLVAMPTEIGIKAFYQIIHGPYPQTLVMEGVLAKTSKTLFSEATPQEQNQPSQITQTSVIDTSGLVTKIQTLLTQTVSKTLKIKPEDIDLDVELSEFGFDSITLTDFSNQLNQTYQLELTPTLFFEYPTLESLSAYFAEEHEAIFAEQFCLETEVRTGDETMVDTDPPPVTVSKSRSRLAVINRTVTRDQEMDPIAIIGMSGCFPEAENIDRFWQNLVGEKDCISEVPPDRWDWKALYGDPHQEINKTRIKWGGFIQNVGEFDPLFFGISPREAELMDPQQRLLMTYAYLAIEDAGYSASDLSGSDTGIFVGTVNSGYSGLVTKSNIPIEGYTSMGMVPSIGPNRMSFFLNLHGPSEPIETACSSSLIAIHRAVQAITAGNCSAAIVGGVNTIITPEAHISFGKTGMLCEDGKCKTFSSQANGYVRGEGVGMLFLKKLSQAESDRDHIYGVIKGSAENHGGRANSLTAPNPKAQADLIKKAWEISRLDPQTIGYIEAHGTGTELGDPIEINGLKSAFKALTQQAGDHGATEAYCGLGSVKTNIGHLELAAGVAGVIKVLLQFKHKKLIKSLHCDEVNPYIDLKGSPFYIVQETQDWKRLKDAESREIPRRAGVSSFGFGGANAHVVLEEYIEDSSNPKVLDLESPSREPIVIPLSARTKEQLEQRVRDILGFIRTDNCDASLQSLAYTLQVGRDAMEVRLGLLVKSKAELEEKLECYLAGDQIIEDFYIGHVKRDKRMFSVFTVDEDMRSAIESWIKKRKLSKILNLWVDGLTLNWHKLYGEEKPKRISLPTYPFAKERYWVPETYDKSVNANTDFQGRVIHPLIHENMSDLFEQTFTSTFTGKEFYLSDHQIKGNKFLPGVCYLEMAYRSGTISMKEPVTEISDVIWSQPINVSEKPKTISIRLVSKSDESDADDLLLDPFGFEVFSPHSDSDEEVIYCQGNIKTSQNHYKSPQVINLKEIINQCHTKISKEECYKKFDEIGLNYGPAFQSIETLQTNGSQVITKLRLPKGVAETATSYQLHPSLFDGALQSVIGLSIQESETSLLKLPFAIDRVQIFGKIPVTAYVVIQKKENQISKSSVEKFDLKITDKAGDVVVAITGFSVRTFNLNDFEKISSKKTPKLEIGVLTATPSWKKDTISSGASYPANNVSLFTASNNTEITDQLHGQYPNYQILELISDSDRLESLVAARFSQVFHHIKAILQRNIETPHYILVLVSEQEEEIRYRFLSGLLKTATIENPWINGKILTLSPEILKESPQILVEELSSTSFNHVEIKRLSFTERFVKIPEEFKTTITSHNSTNPIKENGIYLITGGMGGLGQIFAERILQTKNTTVILTNRSELNAEKKEQLTRLNRLNGEAVYMVCDLSKKDNVKNLIENIQTEYGELTGILHSAGIINDSYILKKTDQEIQAVFQPKVTGLIYLDEATKEITLEFMVLFSSIVSLIGNTGQCDYATANLFMDSYSAYRNTLVEKGERSGKTISINWPQWDEGGMRIAQKASQILSSVTGMMPMSNKYGLQLFEQIISGNESQYIVVHGEKEKIKTWLFQPKNIPEVVKYTDSNGSQSTGEKNTINVLKEVISQTIKLPVSRINDEASFASYGIDSLTTMELTNRLEKQFGPLSKTLFFEYQTVRDLAGYITRNHADIPRSHISTKLSNQESQVRPNYLKPTLTSKRLDQKKRVVSPTLQVEENQTNSIAIIGMTGRYPMATNLEAFWDNLKRGKDCIQEIPSDRWDWRDYYDREKGKPGKTACKWGGFLENVDQFDPHFFNISPIEARIMDPKERLFLESVWELLENTGYTRALLRDQYQSRIGVYVGAMYQQYQSFQSELFEESAVLVSSYSSIANRVSYFFNLQGPSIAIDTMCSSASNAIHMACESLIRGESQLAIAGGVNLSIHPKKYLGLSLAQIIGSSPESRSFAAGDGYIPSEGVGAVLLKPISRAIRDNDNILAVIKSTTINNGGQGTGFRAPNPILQAQLIDDNLTKSGINPRTINYVEAAANGSALGDPIELSALNQVFQKYSQDQSYCAIGSAKSNIGHAEAASGMSQLAKVVLQLRHKQLVPSLIKTMLNPNLNFNNSPFYLQKELVEWQRPKISMGDSDREIPRRALINSFGAGGSNTSLIIEEYIPEKSAITIQSTPLYPELIVFSAKNSAQLIIIARQMLEFLKKKNDQTLANIAYTLQMGREAMSNRLALVVKDLNGLQEGLRHFLKIDDQDYDIPIYTADLDNNELTEIEELISSDIQDHLIEELILTRNMKKLGLLWTKGILIPWKKIHHDTNVRIAMLPTYPFARERYWIEPPRVIDSQSYSDRLSENQIDELLIHSMAELKKSDSNSTHKEVSKDSDSLFDRLSANQIDELLNHSMAELKSSYGNSTHEEVVQNIDSFSEKEINQLLVQQLL